MYVLDTNVISELRKAKTGKLDGNVKKWAESVSTSSLFLSSITILELELGILLKERKDIQQGQLLRTWLNQHVLPTFLNQILDVDTAVAQCCAALPVPDPRPQRDALIAATAIIHSMTLVTRNISDFTSTGVKLLNPWGKPYGL